MEELLSDIEKCTVCSNYLELGARPIISTSPSSKILIIGQAPGIKVHKSGKAWDDPSGIRLRSWMGIDEETFYDPTKIALVPMGFCYPGKGKTGDLPPRSECAPLWHELLLRSMTSVKLTLLFGIYAQSYYLREKKKKTLTETVRNYENYLPEYLPMPHPSPRNNIWLKKNPWFEKDLIPILKQQIRTSLKK